LREGKRGEGFLKKKEGKGGKRTEPSTYRHSYFLPPYLLFSALGRRKKGKESEKKGKKLITPLFTLYSLKLCSPVNPGSSWRGSCKKRGKEKKKGRPGVDRGAFSLVREIDEISSVFGEKRKRLWERKEGGNSSLVLLPIHLKPPSLYLSESACR